MELKEQEEEDGDRQEEKVEKREKSNQGECAMDDHADGSVNALRT